MNHPISANGNDNKKRKREDQSVSNLRFQWHVYISRILSCKAIAAQKEPSPEQITDAIKTKCHEVILGQNELKSTLGRMESVVRGKEEEMRGLILDKASVGAVGRSRRRWKKRKS